MSKPLALIYSLLSIALMTGTAIAISYNAWLAIALGVATCLFIGGGFMLKSRLKHNKPAER
ncbi:DUF5325 family protein [Paenibacillus herberti]|uniref:DUF5325 family protein n=1 Tax=Paenibacillus herberti TaxID=1619309 RepID=A0A229NT92_9BACL|nr:DUF5325 family protein [Paenibacillus herberti]OXM13100.1 hypothetical protein CGZ75_23285 [Paenibacillus herberti]SDT18385.1 hypothetical protein SAMN05444162_3345 [Paenibacillaceae bacterium GAS479]